MVSKRYGSKDMSDKYLTVIRKWDFCGEDTVFDNDTSGKAARSEKDGEIPMRLLPDSYCRIFG